MSYKIRENKDVSGKSKQERAIGSLQNLKKKKIVRWNKQACNFLGFFDRILVLKNVEKPCMSIYHKGKYVLHYLN